jgi:hypothetical protein
MKDRHIKYVEDVVKLSEKSGERLNSVAFQIFKRMLKKADGDPTAFVRILKEGKQAVLPLMLAVGKNNLTEARRLGLKFKKAKDNAV